MMQRSSVPGAPPATAAAPLVPRPALAPRPFKTGRSKGQRRQAKAQAAYPGDGGAHFGGDGLQLSYAAGAAGLGKDWAAAGNEDWVGSLREQGRALATEMIALKAKAEKKVARLAASQVHLQADQQLVSKLRGELIAAKRELEALQGEAVSSTALRDELASRTAALEATRDQLLQLKEQRTEELQASVIRYAELEAALAAAERSMEYVVDAEEAKHLKARVAAMEAELKEATSLADMLTEQLSTAQHARVAAERAQREASAVALRAQAEAEALARKLADRKGELAYRAREAAAEANSGLRSEYELAAREAEELREVVASMQEQLERYKLGASQGGASAPSFRSRAYKMQMQLGRALRRANAASARAGALETALVEAAEQRRAVLEVLKEGERELAGTSKSHAQRESAIDKAQQRLQALEEEVRVAMDDCDSATSALADAMRGQHVAEQTQAAVEAQLRQQVARVAQLERKLAEQAAAAQAAAEREQALELQLNQQAARVDEASSRATELEAELARQARHAQAAAAKVQDLEAALARQGSKAGAAEEKVKEREGELALERERMAEASKKMQLAAVQLAQQAEREKEAGEAAKAATEAKHELRAKLELERARSGQLENELVALRRQQESAEAELGAMSEQMQRAEAAAERSVTQLAAAQGQLKKLQSQLDIANAELEALRSSDKQMKADLAQASQTTKALTTEIDRLTATIADKDLGMHHWRHEAEQATELAQTAANIIAQLQTQLEETRQAQGVSADVLQEQLRASHVQTQSLREELAAARAQALETQKLREDAQAEAAMFKEILASTEAAAAKMSTQLMALLKEKEAMAATALARADGTAAAVLQGSAGVALEPLSTPLLAPMVSSPVASDYITEEEVEGLLDELDLTRTHLESALKQIEEANGRADRAEVEVAELRSESEILRDELALAAERQAATEMKVAALQAQAEAAASRTVEAQVAVARLTKQMEQLQAQAAQAKEEAQETKGEAAGVGRRMRSLMQELAAAKKQASENEAMIDRLVAEKTALLKELAFGRSTSSGGAAPAVAASNINPWRLQLKL